jgi:uncharacterized repeat protein (TIGR03803 family)
MPTSGLIADAGGNLYGATQSDTTGKGLVFELSQVSGSWQESVLYTFTGRSDGDSPYGPLVMDAAGNLYGTTTYGGNKGGNPPAGCGTVFKLTPNAGTWTKSVLYAFHCQGDGGNPIAPLIFDAAGNLYGTTPYGGRSPGSGVIFELSPTASGPWQETVLHKFTGGNDGTLPFGGLVFDGSGNLYGTSVEGGDTSCTGGCGVVFKLAHSGGVLSVIHKFHGPDGANPESTLVFDSAGNLFGTTNLGGTAGSGTVFELSPNTGGWTFSSLYSFRGSFSGDGAGPVASMLFDTSGNLYGITNAGYPYNAGTVFKLTPHGAGAWSESLPVVFISSNYYSVGGTPNGSLVLDASGNLYGTNTMGGESSCTCGTVFKVAP